MKKSQKNRQLRATYSTNIIGKQLFCSGRSVVKLDWPEYIATPYDGHLWNKRQGLTYDGILSSGRIRAFIYAFYSSTG